MNHTISVIIPIYRKEHFIMRCLDSVLRQTYAHLEIILVDDGSPDNCGKICDDYAAQGSRIKVIHQENAGLCAARNAALGIATGDFYGFVDPDDWIAPDMFEYLLSNALRYDADISCCRYYSVADTEETYAHCDGITSILSPTEAIQDTVKYHNHIGKVFWNKLFRKKMFDGILFPEGRIYEGNYMLHLVLEKANKIVLLGDPKYYYYDNGDSYTNTISMKNQMDFVIARIKRYNDLAPEYPELREELLNRVLYTIRYFLYSCDRKTQADIDALSDDITSIVSFLMKHDDDIKMCSELKKYEISFLLQYTLHDIRRIRKFLNSYKRKVLLSKIVKVFSPVFKHGMRRRSYFPCSSMTQYQKDTLRKLQLVELEILNVFASLCEKHNLKYYLYGGTLLGALRHKGFIPWDDDVDVAMPREDFETFKQICAVELGSEYFYQTSFDDAEYPCVFSKIRKHNTYVEEEKWKDRKTLHKGIFIDIFPLDFFPQKEVAGKIFFNLASILHKVIVSDQCRSQLMTVHIAFRILKILPVHVLYKLRHALLLFSNSIGSRDLYCSFGSHYMPMKKRLFKSAWFGEGVQLEFEGGFYRVPSQYDKYLTQLFGKNYMNLPPEEERICHFDINSVRFSKS